MDDKILVNSLSVIIPSKNEEKYISNCLRALSKQFITNLNLEIILIDNGSTDKTIEIAKKYNSMIEIYSLPGVTISEVRNFGAKKTKGEWLAFVDSDVEVDDSWSARIVDEINKLEDKGINRNMTILGSTYAIPNESPYWIERVWFEQLKSRDKMNLRYINGGNLIINRNLFDKIGGFNKKFVTGEDEKLCQDAIRLGAQIINNPSIKAVHHGYPRSLTNFFFRERWHGLGMKNYLSNPWNAKDLMLSLYFIFLSVIFFVITIINGNILINFTLTILGMLLPLVVISLLRCKNRLSYILPLTLLFFVYGCARICSLFDILKHRG
jgi:glycosyltransferase involved in cell wall biosynthesis